MEKMVLYWILHWDKKNWKGTRRYSYIYERKRQNI